MNTPTDDEIVKHMIREGSLTINTQIKPVREALRLAREGLPVPRMRVEGAK